MLHYDLFLKISFFEIFVSSLFVTLHSVEISLSPEYAYYSNITEHIDWTGARSRKPPGSSYHIGNTNVVFLKEPHVLRVLCFQYSRYSLLFHEYGTLSFLYLFNSATNLTFSPR